MVKRPRNKAQRRHNVRRVLEILRKKKEMPLEHLLDEDPILNAETEAIVPLLLQVSTTRGCHVKALTH